MKLRQEGQTNKSKIVAQSLEHSDDSEVISTMKNTQNTCGNIMSNKNTLPL